MARRGQLRSCAKKWWRVHFPIYDKSRYQTRGAREMALMQYGGVKTGFCYFPRAIYPHVHSVPAKREEIPIWPKLTR